MVNAYGQPPRAGWASEMSPALDPKAAEMKRPPRRPQPPASISEQPGRDLDDWWRVTAMVAAVIGGSALIVYVLIEWAAGM